MFEGQTLNQAEYGHMQLELYRYGWRNACPNLTQGQLSIENAVRQGNVAGAWKEMKVQRKSGLPAGDLASAILFISTYMAMWPDVQLVRRHPKAIPANSVLDVLYGLGGQGIAYLPASVRGCIDLALESEKGATSALVQLFRMAEGPERALLALVLRAIYLDGRDIVASMEIHDAIIAREFLQGSASWLLAWTKIILGSNDLPLGIAGERHDYFRTEIAKSWPWISSINPVFADKWALAQRALPAHLAVGRLTLQGPLSPGHAFLFGRHLLGIMLCYLSSTSLVTDVAQDSGAKPEDLFKAYSGSRPKRQ